MLRTAVSVPRFSAAAFMTMSRPADRAPEVVELSSMVPLPVMVRYRSRATFTEAPLLLLNWPSTESRYRSRPASIVASVATAVPVVDR
jgi:hypothetical protein